METFYEVMRRQGISRRSLLKFCSLTATSLGLGPAFVPQIAHAMENKPRTPVLWLHGLECTCCSESFIRSAHPLAKDVVLSMISLDYDDLLMAAAGHQAEAALDEVIEKYKQYLIDQYHAGVFTRQDFLDLDGKTLGCFCKPHPCHGDVLIEAIEWFKANKG